MKNVLNILCLTLFIFACKEQASKNHDSAYNNKEPGIEPVSDEFMESAIIYEANIRQYSPEGTFNAFTKDIPAIKELGVKVIWVMPIHPISKAKRKATGDLFTTDIKDPEERKKYLGSYYSVSDYKAINPEFGTLQDFKNLVETAHSNGIYVIIDWVPNHTGWDHPWITDHRDWYTQNEEGEIIDPIDPYTGESWGWTDVADLNYDKMDMRNEMIADMKFWVDVADIDGFRVDVAHNVPPEFFSNAIEKLQKVKPLFMLAEAEQQELFQHGFDMQYAWEGHHLLNHIAKGEADANDFAAYLSRQDTILSKEDFKMNFVTNHDENSWAGSLQERMSESKEFFTALTYCIPGMPLIYSGQEYDLSHRLKFFEKDSIPKTKGSYFNFLTQLGKLKNKSLALHGGKDAAAFSYSTDNENLISFTRSKNGQSISFVGNISKYEQEITGLSPGTYTDYLSNTSFTFDESQKNSLDPWEFKILVHK